MWIMQCCMICYYHQIHQILLSKFGFHPNFMDDKLGSMVKVIQHNTVDTPILCPFSNMFSPWIQTLRDKLKIKLKLNKSCSKNINYTLLKGDFSLQGNRLKALSLRQNTNIDHQYQFFTIIKFGLFF